MQTAKRILLVDDDKDDQEFFCEALTRVHPAIEYEVANNGLEALSILDTPPPFELVFLDLNMPKMDGFQCLEVLKSHPTYKHIPVIVLSTSSREEDRIKSKKLGASAFFTKPSSFDGLFDKLTGILSNNNLA